MSELRGRNRVFVPEYDFAKYFDSNDHAYLFKILDKHFLIAKREGRVLDVLVRNCRPRSVGDYRNGAFVPWPTQLQPAAITPAGAERASPSGKQVRPDDYSPEGGQLEPEPPKGPVSA